jgi:hypothetical protein
MTAKKRELKVLEITTDGKVRFDARSSNSGAWGTGSTLSAPPIIEEFVDMCERVVSLSKPTAG